MKYKFKIIKKYPWQSKKERDGRALGGVTLPLSPVKMGPGL